MPLSSTASYSGETEATLIMGAQGYELRNGSSQINVNFNTSRLDVDLSGFTATNIFSQTVTTAPVDQIKGTGLVINGNGFSGGTFTTLTTDPLLMSRDQAPERYRVVRFLDMM
jgi:hypothetical protein